MIVFPKNITEDIWKRHLKDYSTTLHGYDDEILKHLPDLSILRSVQDLYICPLCLNNYFINTVNGIQGNSEFSLDHLPPQSVGGKFKILTCKKCNNNSGAFEAELERILNFAIDKNNPETLLIPKIKVRDSQTGKFIHGDVRHKENITDISFNENAKKYNQDYIDFLKNMHSADRLKLQIEIPLFNTDKIEKSLLKSAYLICFVWWGYEFVFSNNAFLIREVLNGKIKYPVPVPISWQNGEKGVSLVCLENERIAFMVGIELMGFDVKTVVNIMIPNPTDLGWTALEKISDIISMNSMSMLSCFTLPRVKHSLGYTISWNILLP